MSRRIRLLIKDKEDGPPSRQELYAEGIKERNESCGACTYYKREWFDVLVTRVLRPVS